MNKLKELTKQLNVISVTIEERNGYWRMIHPHEATRKYLSAGRALTAVKEMGEAMLARGESSCIVVNWLPKTKIGRLAVKVLTS